jgi:hypothetical protein
MSLSLISAPQTAACSTGERKSKRSNPYLGKEEWEIIVVWEAGAEAEQIRLAIRKEKTCMARGSRCGTKEPEDRRHNWRKVGSRSLVAMRC